MKLRNKLAVITAAAMLAFAGIGFASWTFKNTVDTEAANATVQVKAAVELNDDFALYNAADDTQITTLYLICDAPESGNSNVLAGHGVYWSLSNDADDAYANKIETVYVKGHLNYDANDIADLTSVTVQFTSNCTLTNGTYITFGTPALPANLTVVVASNAEVESATFALPVPSYTSAVNSFDDITDVDLLSTDVTGLVISYHAQIISKVETE